MEKVVIIGLGLMGGSIAKDLKNLGNYTILGMDHNKIHEQEALQMGWVDELVSIEKVSEAHWVILAVPVNYLPSLALEVLHRVHENTIVFDMGSIKNPLCNAVRNHPKRSQLVAVHPIAGTENSGPSAAINNLFKKKLTIICESSLSCPQKLEKTIQLWKSLGARIQFMESVEHDKHLAYVSHLSHISSFMLGKTVLEIEKDERQIFNLAGSGFESTVRLAKSAPPTWAPIFLQNHQHILKSLDEYIHNLQEFRNLIYKQDEPQLSAIMHQCNHVGEILAGIALNNHQET
ncbi:MAG: prephenate dehydrogenase [Flavobacteriaceae bacterium]|nr:prephenate dehydrogenase [Flavobacteriaceae bacterium]